MLSSVQFSRSIATPCTAARQASLSITNSRSSPKLMSIESVMPSNHLILCRPHKGTDVCDSPGVASGKKKKGYEKIFEEIIIENFPNMEKEIVSQVQETKRVPYRINSRRNMPRHILIKLTRTKTKKEY